MKNTHTQYQFVLLPGLDGSGNAYTFLKTKMLQSGINNDNISVCHYHNESSYTTLLNNVKELVTTSELPVVLIAESFAGPLALALASQYPDKVKKLILSASFGVKPTCTFIPSFHLNLFKLFPKSLIPISMLPYQLLHDLLLNNYATDDVKSVMEKIYQNGNQSVLDLRVKEVVNLPCIWDDYWTTFIDTDTLILKPMYDRLLNKNNSDILRKNLMNSEIIEMNAPHLLLQTHAGEAWEHILEFINR